MKRCSRSFNGHRVARLIPSGFLPFYRDAFRVLVLQKSLDEVSRMNGCRFHTDGVHLNSRGGMIAADLIQQFIDGSL